MGKRHSAWCVAALALTLVHRDADAQRVLRDLRDDVKHVGQDVAWVWSSPVRGDQKGWIVAGATAVGFFALLPLDEPIDNWVVKDSTRGIFKVLKPVRKGGDLYGGSFMGPIAGAAYVAGLAFDKPGVRDAITGCGSAYLANSYARKWTTYKFTGRARPAAERGNWVWLGPNYRDKVPHGPKPAPDSVWFYRSFPGGHLANMMSCASFFGHRYEWGWVEPVLYTFAGAVGLGRFPDRAHWASDQLVGAVFGFAVGKAVADRQLARLRKSQQRESPTATDANSREEAFSPFADPSDGTLKLGWQVRF